MAAPPFAKRFRRASRFSLYGSLLVVAISAWLLVTAIDRPPETQDTERWIFYDYANDPAVELLRQYVRIDTSDATGDEVRGARFLAGELAAAGIPSTIERLGAKHANLYALLAGEDPHPLVLHSHIDVKDVDPREWIYPPFEGRIVRPWIWGRGVFDMKSVAIAQMLAMIDLKKSGKPLRRSVLLLATGGEEEGDSHLGAQWVIREHPEMVKNFWAVLTEGGTVELRARNNVKYWGTEVGQKHFAKVTVCSDSRQRLEDLRSTLIDRGYTSVDLRLEPAIADVLRAYGPSRDSENQRRLVGAPEALLGDVPSFRATPPYVQSMLRNEAVPFTVEASPGGGFEELIMLHLLPGTRAADVFNELLPPWMLYGISYSVDEVPGSPPPSAPNHPAFRAILAAVDSTYPGITEGPFFLPWTATDARFFRAAGVPAFGFSPFLIMSTDTYQVDRQNERLGLPGFLEGVHLYSRLLSRLVT
jgi:acetylornithine deacetylase/succinyl-diaminopimelate desuccinylase-like protein